MGLAAEIWRLSSVKQSTFSAQRIKSKGGDDMDAEWILCPLCGGKTRDKIREDTVLVNYPLYCPKCKHECLIKAEHLHITVIKEPAAKTQSR